MPEFTERVYSVIISEDTALQQEVTNVLANDPDENDALTYRITSGGKLEDRVLWFKWSIAGGIGNSAELY